MKTGQIDYIEKALQETYKCTSEICVYHDTYFDMSSNDFKKSERELRLRKITFDESETIWLTYKDPPFERISKSKREHEIQVSSHEQAADILRGLGYVEDICFEKHCTNLRVVYRSLNILVTLVKIAQLKQDFVEVEVLRGELDKADQVCECLQEFLSSLQVMPEQLTNEYYTEMVTQARNLNNTQA